MSEATKGGAMMSLAQMRQVGKSVAKDAGGSSVQAFFESNKDKLQAILPKHMTPERMLRVALGALRTTPKLMQCTVDSLFGAVVTCSSLGLEPNTPQGHIYLLPFDNRKAGRTEVQVIIGYKGLVDLARRSGQIVSISARTRCENDEWRLVLGTEDSIHHIPADGERGKPVGFYAVAKLKDGGVQFEYMSVAEVNKVKAQSRASGNGPWVTHFEEMAKKTVVRRLCKMLPMSIELARAAAMDEMAEAGKPQDMGTVLDGEWSPVEETAATDWPLYDAGGEVLQADAAASWEKSCRETLAALEDARAVSAWRAAMEEHFEVLRHRDASAVERVENAAQDRMDKLAEAEAIKAEAG